MHAIWLHAACMQKQNMFSLYTSTKHILSDISKRPPVVWTKSCISWMHTGAKYAWIWCKISKTQISMHFCLHSAYYLMGLKFRYLIPNTDHNIFAFLNPIHYLFCDLVWFGTSEADTALIGLYVDRFWSKFGNCPRPLSPVKFLWINISRCCPVHEWRGNDLPRLRVAVQYQPGPISMISISKFVHNPLIYQAVVRNFILVI